MNIDERKKTLKHVALKRKAIRLRIPTYIKHNNEEFVLRSIEPQRSDAVRFGRLLEKESTRYRIKFFGNIFAVYGDKNGKRKSKKTKKKHFM